MPTDSNNTKSSPTPELMNLSVNPKYNRYTHYSHYYRCNQGFNKTY